MSNKLITQTPPRTGPPVTDVYIGKSTMTDYKYMAIVGDRPVHFGTPRQLDYTKTRDKHAKRAYLDAHPGFEKLNRQNHRDHFSVD